MAPKIDYGWSAAMDVPDLKARIKLLEQHVSTLAQAILAGCGDGVIDVEEVKAMMRAAKSD